MPRPSASPALRVLRTLRTGSRMTLRRHKDFLALAGALQKIAGYRGLLAVRASPFPWLAANEFHSTKMEWYVYSIIASQLDYGRLFCNESVSYADFDDDLVPEELVDQIETIAKEYGYDKLPIYCGGRLDQALDELDHAWERTNKNIANGENKGISIVTDNEGNTSWTLSYDTTDTGDSSDFFKGVTRREIADVISDMGDRLKIWPNFQHKKFRYTKQKQIEPVLFIATLLSEAFGLDAEKMAAISNLKYNTLRASHEDFMYYENLAKGNAIISEYIDQLPVSRVWDLFENKRVADGDGQKYVTKYHTLQSRFSAKYYRTRRGISIYSIIANHIPINAKAIGPHEHESHYLFDLLYNNPTNIPIDYITGDTHAINQLNFVGMDLIDTEFIPNIKQIRAAAEKIYSASKLENNDNMLKPCGTINKKLILSEKRGILRVLLSLILQENTQAVIIRKLSSRKRYSRLRNALWEYNKIFRSTHILNVINDMHLRKVIKSARNRTESYHQLQRAIRKVCSDMFKGRKVIGNQISCQATRLVANFMIGYNATLLNGVYLRLVKKVGVNKAKLLMSSISPVAWPHILFGGRYYFRRGTDKVNLDSIITELEARLHKVLDNN